jgi:hypothetical protein
MRKLLATLGLLGGLVANSAVAAPYVFDLTTGNGTITSGGGTGPYVQVTVNLLSSTSATVTFDSVTTGTNPYYLMDGGSTAVNINGTANLTSWSGTAASGATQATYSNGGSGNQDGFGKFQFSINSSDGWASRSTEIVMDFTATGSTAWSGADQVLAANSNGALAAAHIGYQGGSYTGYVAGSGDSTPPVDAVEPMSIGVLGGGLISLALVRRRAAKTPADPKNL